tara:strand:- start:410 stop:601 length:192 start_codon:yes stop_codon:yes gene_type:complete
MTIRSTDDLKASAAQAALIRTLTHDLNGCDLTYQGSDDSDREENARDEANVEKLIKWKFWGRG